MAWTSLNRNIWSAPTDRRLLCHIGRLIDCLQTLTLLYPGRPDLYSLCRDTLSGQYVRMRGMDLLTCLLARAPARTVARRVKHWRVANLFMRLMDLLPLPAAWPGRTRGILQRFHYTYACRCHLVGFFRRNGVRRDLYIELLDSLGGLNPTSNARQELVSLDNCWTAGTFRSRDFCLSRGEYVRRVGPRGDGYALLHSR